MNSPLTEGAIFGSRYKIVRCIAAGGMGAVYEVIHLETERKRALKVMLPHILHSQELRDRFKREARVAAQVDSEFIVDVFDAGLDEATQMPFLVMELLKGEELGVRLTRVLRFSAQETVTFLHQTAMALDKTHKANIVHRDLKPENLFLTQREDGSGRVKVLDFGIAKLVAEGNTQANATRSLGTPMYMAPEQFNTATRVSPSTDIYALGMIAYTFLVGRHYWWEETQDEGNVFAFAVTAMQGPKEPATARASRFNVTLPLAFDDWFRRICNPDPTLRFQIASAAVVELAEVLGLPAPHGSHISIPPNAITQPLGMSGKTGSGASRPGGMSGGTGGTGISASVTQGTGASRSSGMAVGAAIMGTVLLLGGAGAFFVFGRGGGSPAAPADSAPAAAQTPQAPVETAAPQPAAPAPTPTETAAAAPTPEPSGAATTKVAVAPKPGAKPAPAPPPPTPSAKPVASAAPKPPAAPAGSIHTRD